MKIVFPHPSKANKDGLLAVGGNLETETLIKAYSSGIFPWYNDGDPILWWSPDPRFVLFPEKLKISKSFLRTINSRKYVVTADTAFARVIKSCSTVTRKDQGGTWITEDMTEAYCRLHKKGLAHSIEVFYENELCGGLYGVSIGKMFFGESMFHTRSDASKIALYYLSQFAIQNNFILIDAQIYTEHLESLGAESISRKEYLSLLKLSNNQDTISGKWTEKFSQLFNKIKTQN